MTAQKPGTTNPFERQQPIPGVRHILAVSSGKGGVGKSTVAANLALALSRRLKVGLLDADIYGPSVPRLFGALHQKPAINENEKLEPITRLGVKLMSIGFLVEEGAAVVWRGPMLFKAMDQFFRDVNWGDLDVLVIDLPPGTGDVQLSLAQKVPVTAAIAVSTPQNLSLVDVKKAIDMWKRVGVPLAGLVENMAYMINPANGEKMQLFPKGEMEAYLESAGVPKLGEIPFHPNIGLTSEAGVPVVESHPTGEEAKAFFQIANRLAERFAP